MTTLETKLKFELEKEPEMGKPYKVYLRTEWLSSESKHGNFYLLSTAGLGGSCLFFEAKGKTYKAEMKDVFKNLIEQVI